MPVTNVIHLECSLPPRFGTIIPVQPLKAPEMQMGFYANSVDIWAMGATLVALTNRRELSVIVGTRTQAQALAHSVRPFAHSH